MDWNFEIEDQLTKNLYILFENVEYKNDCVVIPFFRVFPDLDDTQGILTFNGVIDFQKTKDETDDEEDEEKDGLYQLIGLGYKIQNGIYEFVLKTGDYEFTIVTNQLPNIQEIP